MSITLSTENASIQGEVMATSPHGTFTVIKLSNRVTIVSSKTDTDDEYIVYVGVRSQVEFDFYYDWATTNGGWFRHDEHEARRSKRVKAYPKELKIRGLSLTEIIKLIQG